MSQYLLWLYPLLILSVVSLIFNIKAGIRFTWGLCLQQVLILASAIAGFVTGNYWLWAVIGWSLVGLFFFVQRFLILHLHTDLGNIKTDAALAKAKILRFLLWGPPGEYWLDMVSLVSCFYHKDKDGAERLLQKWQKFGLPKSGRENLTGFAMMGLVITKDWESIISKYEKLKQELFSQKPTEKKDIGIAYQIAATASRAYAELGQFAQSLACLDLANLPGARLNQYATDVIFMSFFSLIGAKVELEEVLARLPKGHNALPEYARLFWLARCLVAGGKYDVALTTFQEALAKTPKSLPAWQKRISFQIAQIQQQAEASTQTDQRKATDDKLTEDEVLEKKEIIHRARILLEKCQFVQAILNANSTHLAVNSILAVLLISYALTNCFKIFGLKVLKEFYVWCYSYGMLESTYIFQGEWWRLFTHTLLHANVSHLALNMLGLLWFGKLVENLFGSGRFLLIYLLSGAIGGFVQILLNPSLPAVGASGAIMGIFGAAAAAMLKLKRVLPANVYRYELLWMAGLAVVQITLDQIINFFAGSAGTNSHLPRIASFAHASGMFCGFLLGLILPLSKWTKGTDFTKTKELDNG